MQLKTLKRKANKAKARRRETINMSRNQWKKNQSIVECVKKIVFFFFFQKTNTTDKLLARLMNKKERRH